MIVFLSLLKCTDEVASHKRRQSEIQAIEVLGPGESHVLTVCYQAVWRDLL